MMSIVYENHLKSLILNLKICCDRTVLYLACIRVQSRVVEFSRDSNETLKVISKHCADLVLPTFIVRKRVECVAKS